MEQPSWQRYLYLSRSIFSPTSYLPPYFHPQTSYPFSEFPRELSAKVTMVGFPACPAHNIDASVGRNGLGWVFSRHLLATVEITGFPKRNQILDLHQQHSLQWPGSDTWKSMFETNLRFTMSVMNGSVLILFMSRVYLWMEDPTMQLEDHTRIGINNDEYHHYRCNDDEWCVKNNSIIPQIFHLPISSHPSPISREVGRKTQGFKG